jgi:hypothetical protein
MVVKPLPAKHKTEDLGDKLIISIPSPKKLGLILILSFCNLTWLLLEFLIIFLFPSILSRGLNLLLLVVWSGIGIVLVYPLAWQLFGKEEIQITDQLIKIDQVVLGLKRSKECPGNQINDLRLTPFDKNDPRNGSSPGSIYFNYDARTTFKYTTFAGSVDDAEAKQIIAEIQQKFPQYKK